ncbi:unnamed protein product [Urochloa decumbens]|uniref:KIB1-4 beta-propeller domain-containing protein n=1 Tax=Urochloa decumbens TaxID=240449 RepID=A0ABC9DVD0_9POAL
MAGRRRHRRGDLRQARPPLSPAPEDPSPLEPTTPREVAVAKRPSKKTRQASSSTSTSSATCSPDVWSDLLDCLLHQIIALISSFSDLLAFSVTCRSWRAAFLSFPSTSSFDVPPLYLQPNIRYPPRNRSHASYSLLYNCEWQLTDPGKRSSSHCCSPPRNLPSRMEYLGCSYGHLILSNSDQCLLVDVFSGTTMRPPRLKFTGSNPNIYYGVLDGPINSSNSHLLLCSESSMFQWQVGSNSWLEHPVPVDMERIIQIVFLKGKMYAMDCIDGIHTIHLAPQLSMQEVEVDEEELSRGAAFRSLMNWLVVCDDMLLLVDCCMSIDKLPDLSVTFRVFSLDLSGVSARWAEVENLGNRAIFVNFDVRNAALSCTNPERWGGKSNHIYVATQSEDSDEPWTVVELGQLTRCETWRCLNFEDGQGERPENLWVLPSLVYDIGR